MKYQWLGNFIKLLILFSTSSLAAVWEVHNQWSSEWEAKYSQWYSSSKLSKDVFVNPESQYFGIKADCADAAYAFRAIFSFENALPFAVIDPNFLPRVNGQYDRSQFKLISQEIERFDHINDSHKRFIRFINFLGNSIGSFNIKELDTYPISLKSIRPGDLFHFEKKSGTHRVKHVLTIKKINEVGTVDTFYSTQAIKENNIGYFNGLKKNGGKSKGRAIAKVQKIRGIMYKTGQDIPHIPNRHSKGYRRFIWPRFLKHNFEQFPAEKNYSLEQYELSKKYQGKNYLAQVKRSLATKIESANEKFKRIFVNICDQSKDRVEAVNEALTFMKKINNGSGEGELSCMNYTQFDTYSTPMRDKELMAAFNRLKNLVEENSSEISRENLSLAKGVLSNQNDKKELILKHCPINIDSNLTITLGDVFAGLNSGKLSSDPHQGLKSRWGLESSKALPCEVYYN